MRQLFKSVLLSPFQLFEFFIGLYSRVLNTVFPQLKNIWFDRQSARINALKEFVRHQGHGGDAIKLALFTPNKQCRFRAETFSTKEPETLDWIDTFGGGVFFDIGANIGLYSVYYALTKQANVYAFEPSFFNLAVLSKNIYENRVHDKIRIVTNPLTNRSGFSEFTLSSTEEGAALSSFGVDYGYDGRILDKSMSYQVLGMSLDSMYLNGFLSEYPSLLKIDVDGIEHLILAGAKNTLKHPDCRTVLIEVTDAFEEQRYGVHELLSECGFTLKQKKHAHRDATVLGAVTYNQIWCKR